MKLKFGDFGDFRSQLLPADQPNPLVWCKRCQRYHRKYTFTQADYDQTMAWLTRQLADDVMRRAADEVYATLEKLFPPDPQT